MDRDGIRQVEFHNIILLIQDLPAVREKGDNTGQLFIVNFPDGADIAVKDTQVVIISPMNNPVANPEDPVANLQLTLPCCGRIG